MIVYQQNILDKLAERMKIIEIDKAIELNPNLAIAYARKGTIYYSIGQIQSASINWNIALKLDPE